MSRMDSAPKDKLIEIYNPMVGWYKTKFDGDRWPLSDWGQHQGTWYPFPYDWREIEKPKKRIFYYHKAKSSFWFRIFGYGLAINDRRVHKPLFSERMGLTKVLRIGPYSITFLKPWKKISKATQ